MSGHRKWSDVMNARKVNKVPEQETRGGDKPDWDRVVVGQPLTDRPEEYPEPDSMQLANDFMDANDELLKRLDD